MPNTWLPWSSHSSMTTTKKKTRINCIKSQWLTDPTWLISPPPLHPSKYSDECQETARAIKQLQFSTVSLIFCPGGGGEKFHLSSNLTRFFFGRMNEWTNIVLGWICKMRTREKNFCLWSYAMLKLWALLVLVLVFWLRYGLTDLMWFTWSEHHRRAWVTAKKKRKKNSVCLDRYSQSACQPQDM